MFKDFVSLNFNYVSGAHKRLKDANMFLYAQFHYTFAQILINRTSLNPFIITNLSRIIIITKMFVLWCNCKEHLCYAGRFISLSFVLRDMVYNMPFIVYFTQNKENILRV